MAKTITDNLHDFLKDTAWEELLESFEKVSDERVRPIAQSVLSMRDLSIRQSDEVTLNSLRMKGITLTDEVLRLRKDAIFNSVHLLPNLSMLFGSPDFPRFFEYLLGRGVHIQRMYTVDYVNFFEEPEGLLVHEGGDWYLTTQVQIEVENINELGANAEAFVTELFYRYAPIEEVILGISDLIRLIGRFAFASGLHINDKEYVSLNSDIESIGLDFFPTFTSGLEYNVRVIVKRNDGSETSDIPQKINIDKGNFTYENGVVIVDSGIDCWATISCEHLGVRCTKGVQILTDGLIPSPDDVYVIASEVDAYLGSGSISLTLMGVYGSYRVPVPDQSSVTWSHSNHDDCVLVGNKVTMDKDIRELGSNTVTAQYVAPDGRNMTDKIHIKLHPTNTGVFPTKLQITFYPQIRQGETYKANTILVMSDGTSEEVNAQIRASTDSLNITPLNAVTSDIVYADYTAKLFAEYSVDGYDFSAVAEVECVYPIYEILETKIIGQDTLKEGTRAFYKLAVAWSNGATGYVNADWKILRATANSDGTSVKGIRAVIDHNGMLTVPNVQREEQVIIQATILDELGNVHRPTKVVTVTNTSRELIRLDLETDRKTILLGERTYVTVFGTWSDGSVTLEEFDRYQIFVETSESTFVNVGEDESGVYIEYVEGEPQTVIVYGKVNHSDKVVKTEIRYVNLIIPSTELSRIQVNKVPVMEENERVMFGCSAVWSDGRREDVKAAWTFTQELVDDYEDFETVQGFFSLRELSRILTGEELTAEEMQSHPKLNIYEEFREARPVDLDNIILNRVILQSKNLLGDQDKEIKVSCRYYLETDDQELTIVPYDTKQTQEIVSASIQGPITFDADRVSVSYSLKVKFASDCPPYNLSSDWSVDCPSDIAQITSSGYLIPKKNTNASFNITATVQCGDIDIVRTIRVQMKKTDSWFDGIDIFGPEEVLDGSEVTYTAQVRRNQPPTEQVEYGQILFSIDTLAECNFSSSEGILTLPELYSDYDAKITASYSEYDLGKFDLYDEVSDERRIQIKSQKKLIDLEILTPVGLTDLTPEYQMQVKGSRRDGTELILDGITAPKAQQYWRMTTIVEGVHIEENGTLRISKLPANVSVPIEVTVYEGQNFIKANAIILITSESTPTSIQIFGEEKIRNLGSYEYRCVVTRINGTEEDVTENVFWKISPTERKVSFKDNTLILNQIWESKDFTLTAILQEGDIVLETEFVVKVRGILPKYGAAGFGINTQEEAEALSEKMFSNRGGNISLFVNKNEYGYLFYPRDLGLAEFIPIGFNDVSGWDGANNMGTDTDDPEIKGPREIEVIHEDGLREIFYLYRTNRKGFDFASFSVTFKKNN